MPPTTNITEQGPGEHEPEAFSRPGFEGDADAATARMPAAAPPPEMPPAPELATPVGVATGGDRCSNCNAPMSSDQRYCLECGERRGQARFAAPVAATTSTVTTSRPAPGGPRWSPGATLIAGIGTLLLALGIGVLIGRSGNSGSSGGSPKVQVVTVSGAGGAATSAASTAANTSSTPSGSHHKTSSKSNKAGKTSTGANASAATAKTVTQLPPPTVTLGQKGHGAGYQNGHFTGNFFGGG